MPLALSDSFYYQCPHCQEVFLGKKNANDDISMRVCACCGSSFSKEIPRAIVRKKRFKRSIQLKRFLVAGTLAIVCLLGAYRYWHSSRKLSFSEGPSIESLGSSLSSARQHCGLLLDNFLQGRDGVGRSPYVWHGSQLAGIMARYYQTHYTLDNMEGFSIVDGELVEKGSEESTAYRFVYKHPKEIAGFDVVLVEGRRDGKKELKIDWKQLVSYDTEDWQNFKEGATGIFRLYVRIEERVKGGGKLLLLKKPSLRAGEFLHNSKTRLLLVRPQNVPHFEVLWKESLSKRCACDPMGYGRMTLRLKKGAGEDLELIELLSSDWRDHGKK